MNSKSLGLHTKIKKKKKKKKLGENLSGDFLLRILHNEGLEV